MKNRLLILVLPLLFLLEGCDNPFAITPGIETENIVEGIFITSESGEILNKWGNPTQGTFPVKGSSIPTQFGLSTPYPNPSISSFSFDFSLPKAAKVLIWLETANLPNNGANLPFERRIERPFRQVILVNQRMSAGIHTYSTFGTAIHSQCIGGELEPGFYRLFITAGSFSFYSDIYIAGEKGFAPPGLEKFIRYNCDD